MSNRRLETFFIYPKLKDNKTYSGHTIAVILRPEGMYSGIALCGTKDKFNKKVGKKMALMRAEHAYKKSLERINKDKH